MHGETKTNLQKLGTLQKGDDASIQAQRTRDVCQATRGDSGCSTVSKLKIMSRMGKLLNFWWSRRKNVDEACDQR